jgi:hypothetical protein
MSEIATRRHVEGELARAIGVPEHHVIIDVPDPISFEAHFPIFEDDRRFEFSEKSVFSGNVVRKFTEALRRIRLMVPREIVTDTFDSRAVLLEALDAVG